MDWRRENWWVFGDPSRSYRAVTEDLEIMIVTSRTAKFRCFQMWTTADLCESEIVVIGLTGFESLSFLSSRIHEVWSLAVCSWMEIGNDPRYNNSKIFDPFPNPTEDQKTLLRSLGEQLDAAHTKLTLTQMYNVLEKLRAGEQIEGKDREIYDQGLIGILRDLHDRIDVAVADAYLKINFFGKLAPAVGFVLLVKRVTFQLLKWFCEIECCGICCVKTWCAEVENFELNSMETISQIVNPKHHAQDQLSEKENK